MSLATLSALVARHPEHSDLLESIRRLSVVARELPFEPFREPVALMDLGDNGTNSIVNLDAWYLHSWCQHVGYSMRLRMSTFEDAYLSELNNARLLSAQVALRSHLEAAAMAALCLEGLQNARRSNDWTYLRTLIPKTLFGTALHQRAKKDDRVLEMLSLAEQRTVTITSAVEAFDRFIYREHASGQLLWLYSLLCEASHPNHRGTKGFVTSEQVDEHGEFGWVVMYHPAEQQHPMTIQRTLEALLLLMQQGYAAAELLRAMRFSDEADGPVCHGIPEETARHVWVAILGRETDNNAT